ncbi:unnamed protein product, partial [Choristocarpus tenellus]
LISGSKGLTGRFPSHAHHVVLGLCWGPLNQLVELGEYSNVYAMEWTCTACTVVNESSTDICCVCDKPRPTLRVRGSGGVRTSFREDAQSTRRVTRATSKNNIGRNNCEDVEVLPVSCQGQEGGAGQRRCGRNHKCLDGDSNEDNEMLDVPLPFPTGVEEQYGVKTPLNSDVVESCVGRTRGQDSSLPRAEGGRKPQHAERGVSGDQGDDLGSSYSLSCLPSDIKSILSGVYEVGSPDSIDRPIVLSRESKERAGYRWPTLFSPRERRSRTAIEIRNVDCGEIMRNQGLNLGSRPHAAETPLAKGMERSSTGEQETQGPETDGALSVDDEKIKTRHGDGTRNEPEVRVLGTTIEPGIKPQQPVREELGPKKKRSRLSLLSLPKGSRRSNIHEGKIQDDLPVKASRDPQNLTQCLVSDRHEDNSSPFAVRDLQGICAGSAVSIQEAKISRGCEEVKEGKSDVDKGIDISGGVAKHGLGKKDYCSNKSQMSITEMKTPSPSSLESDVLDGGGARHDRKGFSTADAKCMEGRSTPCTSMDEVQVKGANSPCHASMAGSGLEVNIKSQIKSALGCQPGVKRPHTRMEWKIGEGDDLDSGDSDSDNSNASETQLPPRLDRVVGKGTDNLSAAVSPAPFPATVTVTKSCPARLPVQRSRLESGLQERDSRSTADHEPPLRSLRLGRRQLGKGSGEGQNAMESTRTRCGWSCPDCTLDNRARDKVCDACGRHRPNKWMTSGSDKSEGLGENPEKQEDSVRSGNGLSGVVDEDSESDSGPRLRSTSHRKTKRLRLEEDSDSDYEDQGGKGTLNYSLGKAGKGKSGTVCDIGEDSDHVWEDTENIDDSDCTWLHVNEKEDRMPKQKTRYGESEQEEEDEEEEWEEEGEGGGGSDNKSVSSAEFVGTQIEEVFSHQRSNSRRQSREIDMSVMGEKGFVDLTSLQPSPREDPGIGEEVGGVSQDSIEDISDDDEDYSAVINGSRLTGCGTTAGGGRGGRLHWKYPYFASVREHQDNNSSCVDFASMVQDPKDNAPIDMRYKERRKSREAKESKKKKRSRGSKKKSGGR